MRAYFELLRRALVVAFVALREEKKAFYAGPSLKHFNYWRLGNCNFVYTVSQLVLKNPKQLLIYI